MLLYIVVGGNKLSRIFIKDQKVLTYLPAPSIAPANNQ